VTALDAAPGSPLFCWNRQGNQEYRAAMDGVQRLGGASRALAAALVRAGAVGAAMRLAQRYAVPREVGDRELRAAIALSRMADLVRELARHVPEVRRAPSCTPAQARTCAALYWVLCWVLYWADALRAPRQAAPLLADLGVVAERPMVRPGCLRSMPSLRAVRPPPPACTPAASGAHVCPLHRPPVRVRRRCSRHGPRPKAALG